MVRISVVVEISLQTGSRSSGKHQLINDWMLLVNIFQIYWWPSRSSGLLVVYITNFYLQKIFTQWWQVTHDSQLSFFTFIICHLDTIFCVPLLWFCMTLLRSRSLQPLNHVTKLKKEGVDYLWLVDTKILGVTCIWFTYLIPDWIAIL